MNLFSFWCGPFCFKLVCNQTTHLLTDALNCYMCPRTSGESAAEANIECLALGWELSCSLEQVIYLLLSHSRALGEQKSFSVLHVPVLVIFQNREQSHNL